MIRSLPERVVSQLRSQVRPLACSPLREAWREDAPDAQREGAQVIVASLAQAVEECVHNSLDAGASSVEVLLEADCLGFLINDDGEGVAAADLDNLGVRYCTSKAQTHAPACLGFRGEALSAIAGKQPATSQARLLTGALLSVSGRGLCRHCASGGGVKTQRPPVHLPQGVAGTPAPNPIYVEHSV
jgi:hypothetical protein